MLKKTSNEKLPPVSTTNLPTSYKKMFSKNRLMKKKLFIPLMISSTKLITKKWRRSAKTTSNLSLMSLSKIMSETTQFTSTFLTFLSMEGTEKKKFSLQNKCR